jgi:glycosyltransferase involved in cell wall biosynthesis
MRIGIDMTWLKPKKSGGVESYILNLINGFLKLEDQNEYVLFTAKDNQEYVSSFLNDSRISYVLCDTNANDVKGHLIWQNLHQYSVVKKNHVSFCFFPVYEMPVFKSRSIKTVTAIQDIQALHYPEFFSKPENMWFKFAWQKVMDNADVVIATTNYTKNDIEHCLKTKNNVTAIYIPISLGEKGVADFEPLAEKYKIEKNQYFYTVCSMYKHKNLITLLKVMKKIHDDHIELPAKLVISGVGGPNKKEFDRTVEELGIQENVVLTSFVSNEERNALMKNCNIFLFPSVFEGFGMPPIEAMLLGKKVLTTKRTSLPEVTMNQCNYVEDPYDIDEWISVMLQMQNQEDKVVSFEQFRDVNIARQYLDLFYKVNKD